MTLVELSKSELKIFLSWLRHPVHVIKTVAYCFSLLYSRAKPKKPVTVTKKYILHADSQPTFRYCSYIRSAYSVPQKLDR